MVTLMSLATEQQSVREINKIPGGAEPDDQNDGQRAGQYERRSEQHADKTGKHSEWW